MKSTTVKISIGFLILCGLAVLVVVIPTDRVVPFIYGSGIGDIEQKRIQTNWILRKYEVTGFPSEIREWLTRYHGEATDQQVFYSFVDWGLAHPSGFIEITERVDLTERKRLIDRLAGGIIDNLDGEEFANVFIQSDSPIIEEIRETIREQKQP
jgi:hypothetical protein